MAGHGFRAWDIIGAVPRAYRAVEEADRRARGARTKLREHRVKHPWAWEPTRVLRGSDETTRRLLGEVLGCPNLDPDRLVFELRRSARSWWERGRREVPSYEVVLKAACRHLGVRWAGWRVIGLIEEALGSFAESIAIALPSAVRLVPALALEPVQAMPAVALAEQAVTARTFAAVWEHTPLEARAQLMEAARAEARVQGTFGFSSQALALAGIGAAQWSGFGVYLAATTTVGAVSHAVGVTMPFAFYMGMTKAISFLIGPVGVVAVMGSGLAKVASNRNLDRTIVGVALLCAERARATRDWKTQHDRLLRAVEEADAAVEATRRALIVSVVRLGSALAVAAVVVAALAEVVLR